jgi:hypothetical protein
MDNSQMDMLNKSNGSIPVYNPRPGFGNSSYQA